MFGGGADAIYTQGKRKSSAGPTCWGRGSFHVASIPKINKEHTYTRLLKTYRPFSET